MSVASSASCWRRSVMAAGWMWCFWLQSSLPSGQWAAVSGDIRCATCNAGASQHELEARPVSASMCGGRLAGGGRVTTARSFADTTAACNWDAGTRRYTAMVRCALGANGIGATTTNTAAAVAGANGGGGGGGAGAPGACFRNLRHEFLYVSSMTSSVGCSQCSSTCPCQRDAHSSLLQRLT
jgi:hypothetical protein